MFCLLQVNGIDVSNSCHDEVMTILNQAKQPVQVEILTKEDENEKSANHMKTNLDDSTTNRIQATDSINSTNPVNKIKNPVKVDKQVQTDSKWLDDLIYQHCLKCQFELNEQNEIATTNLKELYYKGSDSDDFYEVLDCSDNYIEDLEDDFIDENCDAFEYKVRSRI